jgi:hypothetical protein
MKFCYLDESGTGSEPYAVMVGIIADAYRMHITKKDWAGLLKVLSEILGKEISEIHTADFYAGNGVWRSLDGNTRAQIISAIFKWLKERNHKIVYSAVDKAKFTSEFYREPQAIELETPWRFMALHICLALQKHHRQLKEPKGHTLLIFDKQEIESGEFIKLIKIPPKWTDTYYLCRRNQERLDHIIDVPYFADSRHVGLIQLADFVSFFIRKYVEIETGIKPDYKDEPERIKEWATVALNQAIPTSAIYPKINRCQCADLFYRYAPPCLLQV